MPSSGNRPLSRNGTARRLLPNRFGNLDISLLARSGHSLKRNLHYLVHPFDKVDLKCLEDIQWDFAQILFVLLREDNGS